MLSAHPTPPKSSMQHLYHQLTTLLTPVIPIPTTPNSSMQHLYRHLPTPLTPVIKTSPPHPTLQCSIYIITYTPYSHIYYLLTVSVIPTLPHPTPLTSSIQHLNHHLPFHPPTQYSLTGLSLASEVKRQIVRSSIVDHILN